MANNNNIIINGARIFFRNFAGKEGQFNPAGNRNFCVEIDEELAAKLESDGWRVKYSKPRDDGDIPKPYIPVTVSYKKRAPKILCIQGKRRQEFTEEMVETLDWIDMSNVDLRINGFRWSTPNDSGIKGYLDAMYITIEEDELDKKYAYLDGDDEEDYE